MRDYTGDSEILINNITEEKFDAIDERTRRFAESVFLL